MSYDESDLVIVMGRGHSGTRVIATLLANASVHMTKPINSTADSMWTDGGHPLYHLARMAGHRAIVTMTERGQPPVFDFSRLVEGEIPREAIRFMDQWLEEVYRQPAGAAGWRGWKLPETILAYPWFVRLLPNARYIWWTRDPRSSIMRRHGTDDLRTWGVEHSDPHSAGHLAGVSWLYQEAIVLQTPKPRYRLDLAYESWAANQEKTLGLLARFLPGLQFNPIGVVASAVGRHEREGGPGGDDLKMLLPAIERHDRRRLV